MKKCDLISLKYVGVGILAYLVTAIIVAFIGRYESLMGGGAVMAIMTAMVFGAAREAYNTDRRDSPNQ